MPYADSYQGDMSVDPAPKVYLQNRLSKCRSKLEELEPVLTLKRKCGSSVHLASLRALAEPIPVRAGMSCLPRPGKDTEQLAKLVEAYTANSSLGDADEVLDVSILFGICGRVGTGSAVTNIRSFAPVGMYFIELSGRPTFAHVLCDLWGNPDC